MLFKGRRGAGKTLSMVREACIFYMNGWRVISNFKLPFGEYMKDEDILNIDKNSEIYRCVLVVDEIQLYLDSRSGMSKTSKKFSNFIQQIRKRGIILLCTTQYLNTVDKRLKQHLDYLASPKYYEKYHAVVLEYEDMTSVEDTFFEDPDVRRIVFDAKPIYPLYNTDELIR